jgi:predicted acylesterase/phospholipase RssA
MIKKLVISGGDLTFLSMLGTIKIIKEEIINVDEIFSVSCGSWVGLFLSLKIDAEIIINYFIERPWHKLFYFDSDKLLNLYDSIGIYGVDVFYEIFKPLFKMCNLDVNITMKDLYEYSNIKLNIYSTKYSDLSFCCFNHEKTPDLKVIDAIFMSSSIPIIFKPLKYNNDYYIDGGYNCNFPLYECIKNIENKSEILGIEAVHLDDNFTNTNNDNILSFYTKLFFKFVLDKREKNDVEKDDINKIIIKYEHFEFSKFFKVINDETTRGDMIKKGEDEAKIYTKYKNQRVD